MYPAQNTTMEGLTASVKGLSVSNSQDTTTEPMGSLGQLPSEIRNQIYHLCPAGYVDILRPTSQARALPALGLSRTCHQLKQEIQSLEYDRPFYNFFRESRMRHTQAKWNIWMGSLSDDRPRNMRGLRYQDPDINVRVQFCQDGEVKCDFRQGYQRSDTERRNAANQVAKMTANSASEIKAVLQFLADKVLWNETCGEREDTAYRLAREEENELRLSRIAADSEERRKARAERVRMKEAEMERDAMSLSGRLKRYRSQGGVGAPKRQRTT